MLAVVHDVVTILEWLKHGYFAVFGGYKRKKIHKSPKKYIKILKHIAIFNLWIS